MTTIPTLYTQTPFARAVSALLQKVGESLGPLPYQLPVIIFGGAAVHLYVPARMSEDLDLDFLSRRVGYDREARVVYKDETGNHTLAVDPTYSTTFGPIQEDYEDRAVPVDLGVVAQMEVKIAAPVDLVISKLGRFAAHDQADIRALIHAGLVEKQTFQALAEDAISVYVGRTNALRTSLDLTLQMFPGKPSERPR